MRTEGWTDADVERLLRGVVPEDPDLELLRPFVADLRAVGGFAPETASTALIAAEAATIAREAFPSSAAPDRSAALRWRWRLAPSLAAVAAVMVLLGGMTGVAAAANGAAPGDDLYGIDRALENFGIGNGGVGERLAEAGKMASLGNSAEALSHAVTALEAAGDEESAAALLATAERLRANTSGGDNALQTRSQVADMLEWMATTNATGRDFGQGVAERAKEIGKGDGKGPKGKDSGGEEPGNGNSNGKINGNGPPDGVTRGGPNS